MKMHRSLFVYRNIQAGVTAHGPEDLEAKILMTPLKLNKASSHASLSLKL